MEPTPAPAPPSPLAADSADQQPYQIKLDTCVHSLAILCDLLHVQCAIFQHQQQFPDFLALNETAQLIRRRSRDWLSWQMVQSWRPQYFAVLQVDHSKWLGPKLLAAKSVYREAVDLCIRLDSAQRQAAKEAQQAEEARLAEAKLGDADFYADKVSYAAVLGKRTSKKT